MTDEERYRRAYEYAEKMHRGQTRIGGAPYITHPAAAAELVKSWGCGIDCRITALFHDLLEDTDASEEKIEELGGKAVLEAVKLLTKHKGYKMDEYVSGIRSNPIAYAVKTADRLHNLRSAVCADEKFKRKYIKETREWYYDFSPEIQAAVKELEESL